jgi:upstream activation factor subunit UAF30
MDSLTLELSSLRNDVKSMHKLLRKVRAHQEDPTGEKAKERASKSGFNKLQRVSPELASFLGLAEGEGISRGQVTSRISQYVKTNNLKSPDNGRVIILDDKLKGILKDVPDGVELKITNLQTYIKEHYLGAIDAPVTEDTPATPEAPKKKIVKRPVVKKPVS